MNKEDLGLTDVEFRIFTRILEKGESNLGSVIKELGLHKGTAYNSIRRLEEKGLISFKELNGINSYSVNTLALQKQLEDLEKLSREKLRHLKETIEKAKAISKESKETAKVHVLVGNEGFKTFLKNLMDWAYQSKNEYLFIGRGDEILEHFGEEYFTLIQAKNKKLDINSRVILNETTKGLPVIKQIAGSIRYLKLKYPSPVSTWIYDDTVAIVLWDSKPLLTATIDSSSAADSYRTFFENLWENADAPKKLFESRLKVNISELISEAKDSLDICGINSLQPVHEGKGRIMEILKKNGRIRILAADPFSKSFKERVHLEEQHIKGLSESRILFELKSVMSNLIDIEKRTGKKIEVRFYDSKPKGSIIIVDNKKFMYNKYADTKGEYGATQPTLLINKDVYPSEARDIKDNFEKLWNNSKSIPLNKILTHNF